MEIKVNKLLGNCGWLLMSFLICDVQAIGLESNQGTVSSDCDLMQSSGGSVIASLEILTRPNGISPETVYFSAQQSTDPSCIDYSGGSDIEACRTGQYFGYHFDFDDPDSNVFTVTGNSKNNQISGAPRAVHTFVCDGPSNSQWNNENQQCEFDVKVRVESPTGDWDDACVNLSIKPQEIEYTVEETYCISSDSNFLDCPKGVPLANQLTDSPVQNLQSNFSHRRFLYQRGSTGMYSSMCIGYDERNIRIDAYGTGDDPLIEELVVGTAQGCNDRIPTNAQVNGYDILSKNKDGHVISGWAYDHAASNLRLRDITVGMSATLLTLHNLDLDWSEANQYSGPTNGYVRLSNSSFNCYSNNDLDCDVVPHPYGIFVSEVRSVGDVDNNGEVGHIPDLNIACFNDCGLINSAIIGSYAKGSYEHNLRIMGAWGLLVSNSHFAGDHAGENGPKSKITLRQVRTDAEASQIVNPENFVSGNHAGDGPGWQRNIDTSQHFYPHYNFLIDNVLGDTINTVTNDSAWLEIRAGHQYSSVFGTTFLLWPGADFNSTQLALGGRNITAHNTTFNGQNVACRFNRRAWPQPSYQFDETSIFSDAPPGGQCNGGNYFLPNPLQPGIYFENIIFVNGFESIL